MEVICPFVTKTVHEASIGELICFLDEQGGELAIKIAENDTGYALLAGFSSAPERSALMIQVNADVDCLSYGVNWVFELVQQSSFSFDSALTRKAGAARLSGGSLSLRFGPNPHVPHIGPRLMNMKDFSIEQEHGFAYWTKDWKLWANSAERNRQGGVPLISGLRQE